MQTASHLVANNVVAFLTLVLMIVLYELQIILAFHKNMPEVFWQLMTALLIVSVLIYTGHSVFSQLVF